MSEKECPFCGAEIVPFAGEWPRVCPDCEMELEPTEALNDDSTYALATDDLPELVPVKRKKKSVRSDSENASASAKSTKKKKKKPERESTEGQFPDRQILIIGGLAVAGLILFCCFGIWMLNRGGPAVAGPAVVAAGGPAVVPAGNQGGGLSILGSSKIILDHPVKSLPITPSDNPWKDDPRIADINYPPPPDIPRPGWPLKADPAVEVVISPDTVPALKGWRLHAGMNGPFVIDVPVELANLTGPGLPSDQANSHSPVPLYDLRTGAQVGTFPPQAPSWRQGRLSPDGQYLVGPETTPEATETRQAGKVFVWRMNGEKPIAEIPLAGLVLWADFIAPDRFATVTVERNFVWTKDFSDVTKEVVAGRDTQSWLRVWDVNSGAKRSELDLSEITLAKRRFEQPRASVDVAGDLRAEGELPISDELVAAFAAKVQPMPKLAYVPRREMAAISPGGQYMVLGGRSSMSLITLDDLKIVVTITLGDKLSRMDYRGFNFSEDGETLYGVIDFEHANQGYEYPTEQGAKEGIYLMAWSMRNGQELTRALIGGESSAHLPGLHGPVFPAGVLNGVILARRHPISSRDVRDIPNEFGRDGDLPGDVADFYKGGLVSQLPFIVERATGNGNLFVRRSDSPADLASAPVAGADADSSSTSLQVVACNEDLIRSQTPAVWESRPPRPPAAVADRSKVRNIDPASPMKWAVPRAAAAPAKSTADKLVLWPDAWADKEFASVRAGWKKAVGSTAATGAQNQKAALIQAAKNQTEPMPEVTPLSVDELKSGMVPDDYNNVNNAERVALDWRRYDPETGGLIAAPIELWPWTPFYYTAQPTVAALTSAADRLAVVDPADLGRVDIWENSGTRIVGFRPDQGHRIEWIGWGGDHLLTLTRGRLTAWTIPNCSAVWEVKGDYNAPLTLAPGRSWLTADTVAHTDIVDTTTGEILGRCAPKSRGKFWTHFTALSPDGTKLAHLYPIKAQRNIDPEKVVANIWDMTTGEEQLPFEFQLIYRLPSNPRNPVSFWSLKHKTATGYLREVVWLDNRYFLVLSNLSQLIDSELRESMALYRFVHGDWESVQNAYFGFPLTEFVSAEPSGRLWVNRPAIPNPQKGFTFITTNWRPLQVPSPSGQFDSKLLHVQPDYVLKPGMSIQIDVDLGTAERSQKGAARIASAWQWRGYKVGPAGWTLRLSNKDIDSAGTLEWTGGKQFTIPAVEFQWTLLDPAGSTIWTGTTNAGWSSGISKYRGETYQDDTRPGRVTDFNFGFQDARKAIVNEILDQTVAIQYEWVSPAPRLLLKDGTDFVPLPVEATFDIPMN